MNRKLFIAFFTGFLYPSTWSTFLNIDPYLDPALLEQNQLYLNRKERFLRFDTKDNELEIELGISIPFVKVPLTADTIDEYGEKRETGITVNGPGIVVATTLVLASVMVVPFFFASTLTERGRKLRETGDSHRFWSKLQNLDETLFKNGIDSSSCVRKSLCWMAAQSEVAEKSGLPSWINKLFESWWFKRLTGISGDVRSNVTTSTCGLADFGCSLTPQRVQSFVDMVKRDHEARVSRGWNTRTHA